jgi:hypothetical protein
MYVLLTLVIGLSSLLRQFQKHVFIKKIHIENKIDLY